MCLSSRLSRSLSFSSLLSSERDDDFLHSEEETKQANMSHHVLLGGLLSETRQLELGYS